MTYADEVAKRLTLMLDGRSRNAFAKRIGMPESTFRSYFEGVAVGLEAAARIARGAGISLEWLATGRGTMRPDDYGNAGLVYGHTGPVYSGGLAEASADLPKMDGLFALPQLVVHHGMPALREKNTVLMVKHSLLVDMGVSPANAAGLVVHESAAQARFPTGAILLVDTSHSKGAGYGVYHVLVSGDDLLIRLIARRADGGFDLVADHPDARPETVASLDQFLIAGKIVWAGHRV